MTTNWAGRKYERMWRESCWDERMLREELSAYIDGGESVLDVGCGTGKMEDHIEDIDYTGLDHEESLEPDVVCDSRNINLPDNSYDIVMCKNHLQHVEQWQMVISEMIRLASNKVVIFDRCHDGDTKYVQENDYGVPMIVLGVEDVIDSLGDVDIWGWSEVDNRIALFSKEV